MVLKYANYAASSDTGTDIGTNHPMAYSLL